MPVSTPAFTWGNTVFFNLEIGENFVFKKINIELLSVENQCNTLRVGSEIIHLKISKRSMPVFINGLKLFVVDNYENAALIHGNVAHSLLTGAVLIGVCNASLPFINTNEVAFPVSFNNGFIWRPNEKDYLFPIDNKDDNPKRLKEPGYILFSPQRDVGENVSWMVAFENSTVKWINERGTDKHKTYVDILLESNLQKGFYYFYGNMDKASLEVRKGTVLRQGELLGGSNNPVIFSVLKSDTIPAPDENMANVVSCFPVLYEIYCKSCLENSKRFSKGTIRFGSKQKSGLVAGNNHTFEAYSGKGWVLGCWSKTGEVPVLIRGGRSNVRLSKVLYEGTPLQSVNPDDFFTYEINVKNGTYRVRAKVGDVALATWQKMVFENVDGGTFRLENGAQVWTSEQIVRVIDGKLTLCIYTDTGGIPAGLSEVVFQRIY